MVKIIEKSGSKKSSLEERMELLLGLSRELVTGEYREIPEIFSFTVDKKGNEEGILIIPAVNSVIVYDQGHYNKALRLAQAYESRTKEEFTLDKRF